MQESADPHAGHPGECENCDAVLQGEFCHRCGQSVHNPIRHAGHAVEEFFEAFWHLDGRVFRTLRDLLVPGRVACEYLAGHRQRYIAPMRLFVIFSVLTFFIGQLTLHVDSDPAQATAGGATTVLSTNSSFEDIDNSRTVEEVRRNRDRLLAAVEEGRDQTRFVPGLNTALVATKAQIRAAAANRMAELSGQPPRAVDPVDPVTRSNRIRLRPSPPRLPPSRKRQARRTVPPTGNPMVSRATGTRRPIRWKSAGGPCRSRPCIGRCETQAACVVAATSILR